MGLFTKDIKTMNDLFVHQLQNIYYAENQLVKALPSMAQKATDLRSGPRHDLGLGPDGLAFLPALSELSGAQTMDVIQSVSSLPLPGVAHDSAARPSGKPSAESARSCSSSRTRASSRASTASYNIYSSVTVTTGVTCSKPRGA